jgi:hypothetical protein
MCVKQREHDHSRTDRPGLAAHRPPPVSATREPASPSELDGMRVDSVHEHVLAWQQTLREAGKKR